MVPQCAFFLRYPIDQSRYPDPGHHEAEAGDFHRAQPHRLENIRERQGQVHRVDSGKKGGQGENGGVDHIDGKEGDHKWNIDQIHGDGQHGGQKAEYFNMVPHVSRRAMQYLLMDSSGRWT